MEKTKSMLKGISDTYKKIASAYPITIILIYITSIITAVFIDQSSVPGKFMEDYGIPCLILWVIGIWFAETCLQRRASRLICIAAAACVSVCIVHFSGHGSPGIKEIMPHWGWTYIIVLIMLGLYKNIKASGIPFDRYCAEVTFELSKLAVICSVAAAGTALVSAAFVALILDGSHYMLVIRSEFLVLGCTGGTGILKTMLSRNEKLSGFFILIVKNLLMLLLSIAFVIIYAYILRIIITGIVPSNEIFRILAALFIIGLPIWTIAGSFEENTRGKRIAEKMPLIYIPFILLQGYAIRERILAFGFTPLRSLCLALMVFEIIYIIVFVICRGNTSIMLPVAAVLTIICFIFPGINIYSISNRSQKAIFNNYIHKNFAQLQPEEQSKLAGAYYYLSGNESGKESLSDADPALIDAIIASGKTGVPEYDQDIYILREFPVRNEDISRFHTMTFVNTDDPQRDPDSAYDPGNITFYSDYGIEVMTVNLEKFINAAIASDISSSDPQDLSYVVELEHGNILRLTGCSFTVTPDNRILYLNLSGILLSVSE